MRLLNREREYVGFVRRVAPDLLGTVIFLFAFRDRIGTVERPPRRARAPLDLSTLLYRTDVATASRPSAEWGREWLLGVRACFGFRDHSHSRLAKLGGVVERIYTVPPGPRTEIRVASSF